MPTAVAIATIATSAASNAAAAAARAAQVAACRTFMKGYQDTDNVDIARHYASCVYSVFGSGEGMAFSEWVFIRVAFVALFIGAAIGAWIARRDRAGDIVLSVIAGFLLAALVDIVAFAGLELLIA